MATMPSTLRDAAWVARGTDFVLTESESSGSASITQRALAKAFRAAVLLTGSVKQAEAERKTRFY